MTEGVREVGCFQGRRNSGVGGRGLAIPAFDLGLQGGQGGLKNAPKMPILQLERAKKCLLGQKVPLKWPF